MKLQKARNIRVTHKFTSSQGRSTVKHAAKYIMPPESEEIWQQFRAFQRGAKEEVQAVVNLGYWDFLGDAITADLLPNIPYRFDRKKQTAYVELQDGQTLAVWVDIDLSA